MKRSFIFAAICFGSSVVCEANADASVSLDGGDPELCSQLKKRMENSYSKTIRHEEAGTPVKFDGSILTIPNITSKPTSTFDFNNDGKNDLVIQHYGAGTYFSGSMLFVINDIGARKSSQMEFRSDEFEVYPCQFDSSKPKGIECPLFSQKNDEAGINVSLGKETFFRGRYTDIQVFKYEKQTLLQLRQSSYKPLRYGAYIKPMPNHQFVPLCLFSISLGDDT